MESFFSSVAKFFFPEQKVGNVQLWEKMYSFKITISFLGGFFFFLNGGKTIFGRQLLLIKYGDI